MLMNGRKRSTEYDKQRASKRPCYSFESEDDNTDSENGDNATSEIKNGIFSHAFFGFDDKSKRTNLRMEAMLVQKVSVEEYDEMCKLRNSFTLRNYIERTGYLNMTDKQVDNRINEMLSTTYDNKKKNTTQA